MSTERPRYTVSVDQDLFRQIEDYKFKMRYSTRSDATVDLIEKGLSALNEKAVSQTKKSPAPAEPKEGERLQEIAGIFEQITDEGQEDIMKYSRYVATKPEYKKYTEAERIRGA